MGIIDYKPESLITEDDVENKFIQELFINVLGYDLNNDFKWKENVTYKMGRQKYTKVCDLVIYKDGKPVIIVEAKKPNESLTEGITQVDSYAFTKEVTYSLITNGRSIVLREYLYGNKKVNIIEDTIDKLLETNFELLQRYISKDNISNFKKELLPEKHITTNDITDYRRFFRSIHNIIRNNEKFDPISCFDEFSKILYLKMADMNYRNENKYDKYFDIVKFKNVPEQDPMTLINNWFKNSMKKYYRDVFEEIPELNISINTLEQVLKKLDSFYVKDDNFDIKGRAFEEFLPSQLRGKGLGQFFTPRKIVDFMVELADVTINDTIVDFSCGSGGFLIKAFDKMKECLTVLPESIFNPMGITKKQFEDNLKQNNLFGIDAEPRAVRIAKMNMMLWGDGRKIVRGNGLSKTDWKGEKYFIAPYDENKKEGGCRLILANPPFIKEKDVKILSQYDLAKGKNSVDAQVLFIERGINLLKPEGRMLIVLPEGILSNSEDLKTREYILRNAHIKAIIELPTHTFVQSGVDTINTVVLYVEKYTTELKNEIAKLMTNDPMKNISIIKNKLDYNIFMASAENVGFEPNGRVFVNHGEKTDLDIILEKYKNTNWANTKINILSNSLEEFEIDVRNIRGKELLNDCMRVNIKNIESRLDPSYYLFWKNIGSDFDNFIPLSNYHIKILSNKLDLSTEDALDKEYKLCSVDKNSENNFLKFSKYVLGEDIVNEKQKKLIVSKHTIIYNPYRASIGSFSYVPDELDNSIVSGAYINFTVEKFNLQLLLSLFKTPIYNKYIRVLSTGSVRDNFSEDCLKQILVPNLTDNEQLDLLNQLNTYNEEIKNINKKKNKLVKHKMSYIYSKLNIE